MVSLALSGPESGFLQFFLSSLDTLQLLAREATHAISLFKYIFNVAKFRSRLRSKLFIGIFLLQSLNLASLSYKRNFRS